MPRAFSLLVILSCLLLPTFTHAQGQDVVWNVSYYSNAYLIGEPARTENLRGDIRLDWGTGAPTGLPADYFSVRLGTQAYFAGGNYRFSALADDGVAIRVNSQVIINTFEASSAGQNLVAEVQLTPGFHNIQIDYREAEGAAYLFAGWAPAGTPILPDAFPEPSAGDATRGRWLAEYFNNTTLTPPRAFANEVPFPVSNWGTGAPVPQVNAEGWSARFSTRVYLDAGRYRVTVRADDGVRFKVDGRTIVDQFGGAAGRSFAAEFEIGSGQHDLVLEHVEYGGTAFLTYSLARLVSTQATPYVGGTPIPQPVPTQGFSQSASQPGGSTSVVNPTTIPIPTTQPQASNGGSVTATITARYVNVRNAPRVVRGNIVATASQGQVYPVVGRANNGWVQINVNGVVGWVNGSYVSTPGLLSVPITGQGPTR